VIKLLFKNEINEYLYEMNKKILKMKNVFLLLIPLFFFTIHTKGQTGSRYFTLEDGLSQVITTDLLLDKDGFVWVATQDGLNRFDGQEFKVYTASKTDSTSLPGNLVYRLYQDSSGKIWVGTFGKGLCFYDKEQDSFQRLELEHSTSNSEIITGIVEDSEGNIWVSSRVSGLHRFEITENGHFKQNNYLSDKELNTLYLDLKGNIWTGAVNGQLFHINPYDEKSFDSDPVTTIERQIYAFFDNGKNLFIGANDGLFIYDYQTRQTTNYKLGKDQFSPVRVISSFLKSEEAGLWIGTDIGLFLFDLEKLNILNIIEASEGESIGLSNSKVTAILQLPENRLLVGTTKYLNSFDFNQPYFKNISKDKRGKHLLNDNMIFAVLKHDEDLWVGTSNGGLNLIRNGKTYYFKENQYMKSSISGSLVRRICLDEKNQRLWLATTSGLGMINLRSFDPDNPKFVNFKHNYNDKNTINDNYLKDIVLDAHGNLWGAAYNKGIFRLEYFNKDSIKIVRYKNEIGNTNSLISDAAHCIRSWDNNIWIGTQNGLSKLSFEKNSYVNPVFSHFYSDANISKSLSHDWIYDVEIDKRKRVWVATRNGLNLLTVNNEFESWTVQKQFPNAVVYCVLEDFYNDLWLSTNDGIVRFNVDKREFTHFGYNDGIQGREFNIHAKFRDQKGNIYLGGIEGLTYFNPQDLINIDKPKPLYFSELRVKDQVIAPRKDKNSFLSKSIPTTKYLKFKHNQFPFYLRFSSIDFRQQKDVQFAYKLLPIDEEWNPLKETEIQLLSLPSGDYKLQINGFSRGKEWDTTPLEMNLSIVPPWWASWWAYVLYVILFSLFVFGFYRFQLSRKLAVTEKNRLQEIDTLKNDLYTNITHEFRTPLTVILGLSDTLKEDENLRDQEKIQHSLKLIERNGKNLLLLVNEMLDLAKLESGHLELELVQTDIIPLVKYLGESFQSLAEEKNIELTVYSEIESLLMDLDSNKIAVIVSNLLTNAIKFTPNEGKIFIHLNRVEQDGQLYFFMKIKDNGNGIPSKDIKYIFNRFYQSQTQKSEGSGIGLALTKELVELMQGTISVKSKQRKGSEFLVLLPVTTTASFTNDTLLTKPFYTETTPIYHSESQDEVLGNDEDKPLVLIIEDNSDVAQYLQTCLFEKYSTVHAQNGAVGVEKAFELIPDLIISDVMMPEKDGFQVCEELKTDERTDHIPIVILTAKATSQDKIHGLSCGADAYLSKPFLKEELLTRLDQLITLRQRLFQKFEKTDIDTFLNKKFSEPETKFIQKVIKIVHKYMEDYTFQSAQLAQKLNMSRSQLYRKLKAITGKSIAVYMRSIRLQKARLLLESAEMTISEIAYACGFNDPSWFSKAFKEEYGFSPSKIKRIEKKDE